MKQDRDPLKSVCWLKIIYRNGTKETRGYGSRAEAVDAYQHFIGARKVEHCSEPLDADPDRDNWKSVGEVTHDIITKLGDLCRETK